MTYKYSLTLPISGANKLQRFTDWAKAVLPDLQYKLPLETPIRTETMTIRLRDVADRTRVLTALGQNQL